MQFNSGTPSLISETNKMAIGVSSNPTDLHSTDEIKAAINDAYRQLREIARVYDEGTEFKRTYATTVADQLWYQLPSDFKRIITVEVEVDGTDLTASGAVSRVLQPMPIESALEHNAGTDDSGPVFVAIGDGHFAVVKPVSTGGANALRLAYQAQTADLSNDTDEPVIPETFHSLICKLAALTLRASVDHPMGGLRELVGLGFAQYRTWAQDRLSDPEGQIPTAGFTDQSETIKQGFTY